MSTLDKNISRYILFLLSLFFIQLFLRCENIDRFYRPNTPEKISVIGIIDADDTTRYISIEKSYQQEYSEEINDSLRDLAFEIISSKQVLYSYSSEAPIKNLNNLKIPVDVPFISGEKYFLKANEKSFNGISSECTVPYPPSGLKLISIEKETIPLSEPQVCGKSMKYYNTNYAVINLIFDVDKTRESYYSLIIEVKGGKSPYTFYISLPIEFTLRESNATGFLTTMKGINGDKWGCIDSNFGRQSVPINVLFIDPNNIPDNKCRLRISVRFGDLTSAVDFILAFRIKLLSVPKELFLFEKSIFTYNKSIKDPMAEPVHIEGNIKGGNGVFAICRSSNLNFEWMGF